MYCRCIWIIRRSPLIMNDPIMDHASLLDICRWLHTEMSTNTGGDAVSATIIVEMLQSTMMHTLLSDPDVRHGLMDMVATNSVHVGLEAMNQRMSTSTDEIAVRYMYILWLEHSQLIDPPFAPTDSRLWQFRHWPVSHFNNLLVTI